VGNPARRDYPMLAEQPAHLIDQRGAALEELLAHPVQCLNVLLRCALDRNKPHRRPAYRLADRLGIVGVILVALEVGLHELWAHQLHRMAELLYLARPVVRRTARFHPRQTGLQLCQQAEQVLARNAPVHQRLPADVDAVHPEHILCQIDTDCLNLHPWTLLRCSVRMVEITILAHL